MGTLTCSRCGANTEAKSIEEGRKRLDHGRGLLFNKPCADGRATLHMSGKVETDKPIEISKTIGNSKKPKRSNHKD